MAVLLLSWKAPGIVQHCLQAGKAPVLSMQMRHVALVLPAHATRQSLTHNMRHPTWCQRQPAAGLSCSPSAQAAGEQGQPDMVSDALPDAKGSWQQASLSRSPSTQAASEQVQHLTWCETPYLIPKAASSRPASPAVHPYRRLVKRGRLSR